MSKDQSLRLARRRFGCGVETLERRDCPAALSIANVDLAEGTNSSPIARFTVSLSGKATTPVAVNWTTVDGSATVADNDFQASSGTIVFARGQTSKTVSVYVRGDSKIESNEFFSVTLSSPVGATLGKATATATIVNDDVAQPVIPSLSVTDEQLPERNGGRSETRFTVRLSEATTVPVTVRCATVDGTATIANRDYAAGSLRLVFAPGETSKTVAVSVLGDARIESDETFGLVLSGATGARIAKATGIATILNDDFAPPAPVLASVTGAAIEEGNGSPDPAAFAAFTLSLSRSAESVVTVSYTTFDGSATVVDNDYKAASGTVTFGVGETTKTVLVPIVGDTKPERDETFSLVLVSAQGALPERTPAMATVIDDDTPPELSVVDVSLPEGNSGSSFASFVIALNRPWAKPVDVAYATRDGSATTADSDYVAAQGTVTFAPGDREITVSVSVVGDTRAEINESFFLNLSSASNATIADGTGIAIVQNDDSGEVPGFQITVDYSGTVRQSIRDACDWAADRWSQVITGDLPGVWDSGIFVDDLRITVQEGLLGGGDGPGDTLANAGPDKFRSGTAGLPWAASAGIDPFDASDPQLRNIVLHEFGHALGFGISGSGEPTFYSRFVVGNGFTGPNALREYRSLFSNAGTSVPLETGGGAGTVGAHWRESVFNTELMTGYSEASGVVMPLSAITVGAMQDMGYTVSYAAADPYTAPSQLSASAQQSGAQLFGASDGAVPPNKSTRKGALPVNGSMNNGRSLALEAAPQASLAASTQAVESAKKATAKTPRERIFVALAAGVASAPERTLSTQVWRAIGPA